METEVFNDTELQKLIMKKVLFPFGFIVFIISCFISCTTKLTNNEENQSIPMRLDVHSYAEPDIAIVTHLDWDAEVDFDNKIIKAIASLSIDRTAEAKVLYLDTKGLNIENVTSSDGSKLEYTIGEEDKILGRSLGIELTPDTKEVIIRYTTSPKAEALQWLDPVQTAGGKRPFLFTQSQAILARSWVPIQDSPGIRFTYSATVKVPSDLLALMSAENPQSKNSEGTYTFKMEQPIPAYLLALTVGDITFKPISSNTGVYAEPSVIEAAAYEFAQMDDMLEAAEKLYGAYRWGRYDLIVLPPSFPFGGMENPRLTFATPTILAGDRSLTSLVAHELAHSWSGNLVTNETWDDFWLNEGFTVYFERRIMEAIEDKSYAEMLAALGYQDLKESVDRFYEDGNEDDTKLKLNLKGRDPDEGVSDIAYEKGFFFLRLLEDLAGRDSFDAFLKNYFNEHAFKTINTEDFIKYLDENLINKNNIKVDSSLYNRWIYEPGLPDDLIKIESSRFKNVESELKQFLEGTSPTDLNSSNWSSHEWLHFIRNLPQDLSVEKMKALDTTFKFSSSGNSEVLAAWLELVIKRNYEPGYESLENFLVSVGRRKFLVPLYRELAKTEEGKNRALEIYSKARPNYHYVSVNTLDEMLSYTP